MDKEDIKLLIAAMSIPIMLAVFVVICMLRAIGYFN